MQAIYHTFLVSNLLMGIGFPVLQQKEQNRQISYILYEYNQTTTDTLTTYAPSTGSTASAMMNK